MKRIPQDIIRNIVVFKFPRNEFWIVKKIKAWLFLRKNKNITTALEKIDKISGNLRIPKLKYLAGIKTFETTYKENECLFKFDLTKTYFSPRLSNERKVIAEQVAKLAKNNSKILVCFAGVAPYPITIAKKLKQKKKQFSIISNELNKDASKYAQENVILNKLQQYIKIIQGDARLLPSKLKEKFDIILMPRPNLKYTFLEGILKLSKKGTYIFYHGFGTKDKVLAEIKAACGSKISNIKIRKAGDIAPKQYRWQAEFKVK